MSRIEVVEDSARLARLLRKALEGLGIRVDVFERLESVWPAVRGAGYEAVVIDRCLPNGGGLDLVRRLRAAQDPVPCLMLTARDALRDRVGLNYRISPRWGVGARISTGRVTGSAADSPITERKTQNGFAVFTSYGF